MKIARRTIDSAHPPYVIAEIGVNHDGRFDRAVDLVDAAADAGADGVKLQLFEADRLLGRAAVLAGYQARSGASDPFQMLRACELSVDDIASSDIIHRPLITAMMRTDLPLILSTGAATLEEVLEASSWLGDHPHLFMHCVSAYPLADEDATLGGRAALAAHLPTALGYSDHTTCTDTGGLAVAGGACLLEKHLTWSRDAPGPDHAASLDPDGLREYVRLAHRAWRMRGPIEKRVQEIERDVRRVSRQSLTAVRFLPAGHVLEGRDLTCKRPGTGLSPARLGEVVGRSLARAVDADMPLVDEDLR